MRDYQEWLTFLTGVLDLPPYVSDPVREAYTEFSERLKRIVDYHDNRGVTENDCVRLMKGLHDDIQAWNDRRHA